MYEFLPLALYLVSSWCSPPFRQAVYFLWLSEISPDEGSSYCSPRWTWWCRGLVSAAGDFPVTPSDCQTTSELSLRSKSAATPVLSGNHKHIDCIYMYITKLYRKTAVGFVFLYIKCHWSLKNTVYAHCASVLFYKENTVCITIYKSALPHELQSTMCTGY